MLWQLEGGRAGGAGVNGETLDFETKDSERHWTGYEDGGAGEQMGSQWNSKMMTLSWEGI